MSAFTQKPAVSKAVLALRAYLASAPQAELDARLARVQALNLPKGPTVAELFERHAITYRTQALPTASTSYFTGPVTNRDLPVGDYSYAMAA